MGVLWHVEFGKRCEVGWWREGLAWRVFCFPVDFLRTTSSLAGRIPPFPYVFGDTEPQSARTYLA